MAMHTTSFPRVRRRLRIASGGLLMALAMSGALSAANALPWKLVKTKDDMTIYERVHDNSSLKEFKAIGLFDASPEAIKKVLDDVAMYPKFMPYVKVARVLSQSAKGRLTYQLISPPLVGDRDYTIRTTFATRRMKDGKVAYYNTWKTANEHGPAERKDVVRVTVTEGSWLLEPAGNGQTRATYRVFSDAGVKLPPVMVNSASQSAIPRIFAAVEKQARKAGGRQ